MKNLVLYRGNKRDGRWLLPLADAVTQFKASAHYTSWQQGWPLIRAVALFIAQDLNSTPRSNKEQLALRDAVIAVEPPYIPPAPVPQLLP